MSTQQSQTIAPKHSLPPDQAMAGLGLVTHISQHIASGGNPVPQQPVTSPQDSLQMPQGQPQQGQESQTPDNSQNDAKFTEMEAKMDQMKTEMELMVKDEVSSIKDLIIETLKDDGQK